MATNGELSAARLVERLERLEVEFDNLIEAVKTEYHNCWGEMTPQEMDEFIQLLGLKDKRALCQFIITRGGAVRTLIFPGWMLKD